MKGNLRQSRILDFTLWISVSRYWIPDSLSVERGFQIAIVGGISDSLRWIPDSKAQDFWFHKSWTQNTLRPKTEFTRRRFRKLRNFCLWTGILGFGMQSTARGIRNTRTDDNNPESSTRIEDCLRFPQHVATIPTIFIWEFPRDFGRYLCNVNKIWTTVVRP